MGDGPQRSYLEELAKSFNIGHRTNFLGFVDGPEKVGFMRHASVICVNLTNPGLSQGLIEASSLGNPVITSYDSEAKQHLGTNVTYLEQKSDELLASMISVALDHTPSDAPKLAVGDEFSPRSFVDQCVKLYSETR